MSWFDKQYVSYFKGLARNNKREWFQDNRDVYEWASQAVKMGQYIDNSVILRSL